MASGRQVFEAFLKGGPITRPAFVPLVRGLAARVEGAARRQLQRDSTLWANSLVKTARLFHADGVVAGFNWRLMAEACGCPVSWEDDRPVIATPSAGGLTDAPEESDALKLLVETADRVFQVCRKDLACVGALTGPVTLAAQLFGEEGKSHLGEVKDRLVKAVEAFCKTGPDMLLFLEEAPLAASEVTTQHRRLYNTLKNITSYYNIAAGLYLEGYRPEAVDQFSKLGLDAYILGPSAMGAAAEVSDLCRLGNDCLGVGVGLPMSDPVQAKRVMTDAVSRYRAEGRPGFFFTSVGPLTREANLDLIHCLVKDISAL